MNQVKSGAAALGMILTITSGLLLVACSKPEVPPEPLRAVKVMTVGAVPMDSTPVYAGEVRARVESRLGFRVGGKLVHRAVEVGQHVRAGQVLAQLDPGDLQLGLDAARAQLTAARANRDLVNADFQRFETLKNQNFISAAELERRRTALDAAQSQLDVAQAQLTAQSNQAGYATLLADASGVVTAVLAERGQVVGAGSPVLQLAHDGVRDVVFAVPEDKVAAVKLGATVSVQGWPAGQPMTALVREVAATADPVTRTFAVKATLPVDNSQALGRTVSVRQHSVQRAVAPVIKLPTSALRQQGQATVVWILNSAEMTVRSQPIEVAAVDGNDVVVASGLAPGMQVVIAGVHALSEGQKVTRYLQDTALAQQTQTARSVAAPSSAALNLAR